MAAPQDPQDHRLAAPRRRRHRRLAGHADRRRLLPGGVAAGLARGPAVPDGRVDAAGYRRVAGRPGGPRARLGRGPGARPGLGRQLASAGRRAPGPRVRAGGPGRGPGRAGPGRVAVGVADLRHRLRPGRVHRVGADDLRRPPVAPAGPHRQGPDRRPRLRAPAGAGRGHPGRRDHPRDRAPLAADLLHPVDRRAPGTWWWWGRRAAGRRT